MATPNDFHGGSRRRRRLIAEQVNETGVPPLIAGAALASGVGGLFAGSYISERTPWEGVLPFFGESGSNSGTDMSSLAILGAGAIGSGALIWLAFRKEGGSGSNVNITIEDERNNDNDNERLQASSRR